MRLISWTLAGPGSPALIGDALRSVAPLVDASLVVCTEDDDAATMATVEAARATGNALVLARWSWRNDFGAARNEALDLAMTTGEGASWSCMVDTDERVICADPAALRAYLDALPPHVMVGLAHHADGSHTRERFFRLPCPFRFRGRTHEMMPKQEHEQAIIPREIVMWSELPKSVGQLREKFLRDEAMLRADIADDPENGAARYYLGETLQSLGRHEDAIAEFREHNRLSRWEEGRAWAAYKAAESYFALGQPYRVLECAAAGLVYDAGIAELYWVASLACLAQGWWEQARCWAVAAKLHGMGSEAERRRFGKRDRRGIMGGPDEVLAAVKVATETGAPVVVTTKPEVPA